MSISIIKKHVLQGNIIKLNNENHDKDFMLQVASLILWHSGTNCVVRIALYDNCPSKTINKELEFRVKTFVSLSYPHHILTKHITY